MIEALRTKLWDRLRRKQHAYLRTFCGDSGLGRPHVNAEIVLSDLRKFCGIARRGLVLNPITREADALRTAELAGRRDVYMRIAAYLNLDIGTELHEDEHERPTAAKQ